MTVLDLEVTHVTRLNTKDYQCEEDPDYNVIACLEDYVRKEVECASPWDITEHQVIR